MTDLPHEAELIEREPIFHHHELIWDEQSFDEQIAEDFSEIGASGRVTNARRSRKSC